MSTFVVSWSSSKGYEVSAYDGEWRTVLNIPNYYEDGARCAETIAIGKECIYFTTGGQHINTYNGKNITRTDCAGGRVNALIEIDGRVYTMHIVGGDYTLAYNGHKIDMGSQIPSPDDLLDSVIYDDGRYVLSNSDRVLHRDLSIHSLDTRPDREYNSRSVTGTWLRGALWTTSGYGGTAMITMRDPRDTRAHAVCQTDTHLYVGGNAGGCVCLRQSSGCYDNIYDPRANAVFYVELPISRIYAVVQLL